MSQNPEYIRLALGIEVRPPSIEARRVIERAASKEFAGHLGADLARAVPGVTEGHLVTGPSLLEIGELLGPAPDAWDALVDLARAPNRHAPGVTAIGAHGGQVPHAALRPKAESDAAFLTLPLLLWLDRARRQEMIAALERELFEHAGLHPPALATLTQATGLEPVHGQLMTRNDLIALARVQLSTIGLDPFWPAVEHVLLDADRETKLELPAGLTARWQPDARRWRFDFRVFDPAREPGDYLLWLRALRQTLALLEQHRVGWSFHVAQHDARIEAGQRWVEAELGTAEPGQPALRYQHPELGVIGYRLSRAGRTRIFQPLGRSAVKALELELGACGDTAFTTVRVGTAESERRRGSHR